MKPWEIALFILLVMGGLLLATLFSRPVNLPGMRSEDGFAGGKFLIKYPTLNTFLGTGAPVMNTRVDSVITLAGKPDGELRISPPDFSSIDTAGLERIVYPAGDPGFPVRLRALFEGESCRILHYGDSQLEGDRISGYLRQRLQAVFGGSGPGFIPIKQVVRFIFKIFRKSVAFFRFIRRQKNAPEIHFYTDKSILQHLPCPEEIQYNWPSLRKCRYSCESCSTFGRLRC
jgi:hypothetical protein